MGLDCKI